MCNMLAVSLRLVDSYRHVRCLLKARVFDWRTMTAVLDAAYTFLLTDLLNYLLMVCSADRDVPRSIVQET